MVCRGKEREFSERNLKFFTTGVKVLKILIVKAVRKTNELKL